MSVIKNIEKILGSLDEKSQKTEIKAIYVKDELYLRYSTNISNNLDKLEIQIFKKKLS